VEDLELPKLQLIRDVDTRWSSTYLMIERAIMLKDVSKIIFDLEHILSYLNIGYRWILV
jgi:hypothetical protein